ncbi:polysaccharide deacetylase family protein [Longimicrobium sp.]|uniref:polysaccharide deacetylase family protein n=1 Tax=Longimicrobium sp. TaxID=2029185 RepID=UPI003B3B7144
MSAPLAAVSSDIDTLLSNYKGIGCRRPGGYTKAELRMGLENFSRFLEPYGARATLFMVGHDFLHEPSHDAIRAVAAQGHEIASHTMTHAQGFRLLSAEEKERELAGMEEVCQAVTGARPVGFRSPGWNVGDDALPILQRRGYLYDSSVFPTTLTPLLKFLHWKTMSSRSAADRTTLGHARYMLAPTAPYRTGTRTLGRRGGGGIVEFPITVVPGARLPFFATWLVATGMDVFRQSYRLLRALGRPIQFMFHLSDFVDYAHPELADQVPHPSDGVYVPKALGMPLAEKTELFRRAMDLIAADHRFVTLRDWAERVP